MQITMDKNRMNQLMNESTSGWNAIVPYHRTAGWQNGRMTEQHSEHQMSMYVCKWKIGKRIYHVWVKYISYSFDQFTNKRNWISNEVTILFSPINLLSFLNPLLFHYHGYGTRLYHWSKQNERYRNSDAQT